mmetsp:Transcript_2465/g.4375  ORF Transcript_2465/g.4375 Transcript_2465/m.4375 type:complete len:347 (-) Transcript_2465:410-1450(-)
MLYSLHRVGNLLQVDDVAELRRQTSLLTPIRHLRLEPLHLLVRLVLGGVVLNRPHASRVLQTVLRLIDVVVGGRHVDKHKRLGVPSQAIRQKHGELVVTVRDVPLLRGERADNVAQGRQRLVDSLCLLKLLTRGAALLNALATCEVHKAELTLRHGLRLKVGPLDDKAHHEVTTARLAIHLCPCNVTALLTKLDGIPELLGTGDLNCGGALHRYQPLGVFLNVELGSARSPLPGKQEILQSVLIQLEHAALNAVGALVCLRLDVPEELVDSARRQARVLVIAVNGERLTAPRLSVRKDAHVVAVNGTLHQVLGVLKHLLLAGRRVEHTVKVVLARLFLLLPGVAQS